MLELFFAYYSNFSSIAFSQDFFFPCQGSRHWKHILVPHSVHLSSLSLILLALIILPHASLVQYLNNGSRSIIFCALNRSSLFSVSGSSFLNSFSRSLYVTFSLQECSMQLSLSISARSMWYFKFSLQHSTQNLCLHVSNINVISSVPSGSA